MTLVFYHPSSAAIQSQNMFEVIITSSESNLPSLQRCVYHPISLMQDGEH